MSNFEQGNLESFLSFARAKKGPNIYPQPLPERRKGIVIPEVAELLRIHGADIVYKQDYDRLPQHEKDAVNSPFQDDDFMNATRMLIGTNPSDLIESVRQAAYKNVDPETIRRFSNEFNQEYYDPFEN